MRTAPAPADLASTPASRTPSVAFPALVVVAVSLVLYGQPAPRLSEELYLALVRRTARPSFLRGDWTLGGRFDEHWLFDHLFAPLAKVLSIPALGWVGRLVFWPVLALLFIALGRRLRCAPWYAAGAVTLWLVFNQALVGGEWIIGTFESKTVAYVFLLGGLLAATRRRVPLAIALTGACISFHPAVGLWGAWGVGLALLTQPETRGPALRWCWLGALVAVPGVIGAVSVAGKSGGAQLLRFLTLQGIPYHVDPFFAGKRFVDGQAAVRLTTLAAMFGFNLWSFRRSSKDFAARFVVAFQLALAAPFVVGIAARVAHVWSFLQLFPFRLFGLFVPLCFFFEMTRRVEEAHGREATVTSAWWQRGSIRLGALATVVALVLTAPLLAGPRNVYRNTVAWLGHDDMKQAFVWVSHHVPRTETCILPVWRQDSFDFAQRPQIANWQAVRYDALADWKTRIDYLVGGGRYFDPHVYVGDNRSLERAYGGLSTRQVDAIVSRYHAGCIVTLADYPYAVLHRSGDVKVYALQR